MSLEHDLARVVEEFLGELLEEHGVDEQDLRDVAGGILSGFERTTAKLLDAEVEQYRVGDRVPPHLPCVPCAAAVDPSDPLTIIEHFIIGERLAVRRLRLGDPPGRAPITFCE